ncbi:hypothetical protein [Pseudanabaena sp. BC1403]|nr:hypothetical protein [Pseudanabaena sp. BC1403]
MSYSSLKVGGSKSRLINATFNNLHAVLELEAFRSGLNAPMRAESGAAYC